MTEFHAADLVRSASILVPQEKDPPFTPTRFWGAVRKVWDDKNSEIRISANVSLGT
jgi:hypothetical protein